MHTIKQACNIILKFINDPIYFCFRLCCKVKSIFSLPTSKVKKNLNGIMFEFELDNSPFVLDSFLGKYEIKTRMLMKNILRPGDTFIDVGANIGYLSAIGAGLVGKTGSVHSFEPDPEYFKKLQKLPLINPDYNIIINQCAVGNAEGKAKMEIAYLNSSAGNTMVLNFMKSETIRKSIEVSVKRLDVYIKEQNLSNITLIKIDVEGFEFPVLKGLKNCLINSEFRPAIVCEITPEACSIMDYHLEI